jgi:hypothetical protein
MNTLLTPGQPVMVKLMNEWVMAQFSRLPTNTRVGIVTTTGAYYKDWRI